LGMSFVRWRTYIGCQLRSATQTVVLDLQTKWHAKLVLVFSIECGGPHEPHAE
jgi:hypothetical protein